MYALCFFLFSTQARSQCIAGAQEGAGLGGQRGAGEGDECYRVIEREPPKEVPCVP